METNKQNYNQAPLPFQGQKRRFLKAFKEALNQFPPDATYVDLFGGSGLLSHTVKEYYPNATVVYNDFDGYSHRLANITTTNALLGDIRYILKAEKRDKSKINESLKAHIIGRIEKETGFVDYITLSGSLLFSMNYAADLEDMKKQTLYNKVRMSDYTASGYLQGVEVVKHDYKALFEKYKNTANVVFLVDPPYLSTDTSTYSKEDYWRLSDYLDVIKTIQNVRYFYFTSEKSQIIELCNWMGSMGQFENPFKGSTTTTVGVQINHTASYNDIMIFKP